MSSKNNLITFVNSKSGIIIMSIIWGLGISCLFRRVCKGRNCIVLTAPDPNTVQNNIFKYNDKCYKYSTHPTKCLDKEHDINTAIYIK